MRLLPILGTILLITNLALAAFSGQCSDPLTVVGSGNTAVIDSMNRTENCEVDVQGPNDVAGQKDLNMYCARNGPDNSAYFYWSWDEISWTGSNTGDACILLDSNNNGAADLALCLSIHKNGEYLGKSFYRCTSDSSTTRCFGSESLLPPEGGFLSTCCVQSNSMVDPFLGNGKKDTGDHYPYDTLARCHVYLSDFQASNLAFVDVCSYPSLQPNSDPSDCVLTKFCANNKGEPDDSLCTLSASKQNGCWESYCDAVLGTCITKPKSAGTICEPVGGESFCDGKNVCDGSGVCITEPPLNCTGNSCFSTCQHSVCKEPDTFTQSDSATCECVPNPAVSTCTSECGGDEVCQSGLCNNGFCSCSNLDVSCSVPRDGPCDVDCQRSHCITGRCLCDNLSDDTLCETTPPDFCDGKSQCSAGRCVTSSPPGCDTPCETVCKSEVCVNPTEFTSQTDASCICTPDFTKTNSTCESDGIKCTHDLCDNVGQCQHTIGQCDGCAIDCLVGTCILTPNPDDSDIWNDGCKYSLFGTNNQSVLIPPPAEGTDSELCTSPTGIGDAIARSFSSATHITISLLQLVLFVIVLF